MLNKCQFIGHVGRDPEVRVLSSGMKLSKFSVAVTEKWKSKDGEQMSRTEWIECTCFGKLSDVIEQYVKKGDKLYIEGKWHTNEWETEQGEKRSRTELNLQNMVMLGSPDRAAQPDGYSSPASTQKAAAQSAAPEPGVDEVDDLPF